MLIYLDQNKWIELARVVNGKDSTPRASKILQSFGEALNRGEATFPLSSCHYIEMSRISNVDRKVRLGTVMWQFSKGATILGYGAVVRHELEVALTRYFPQINPDPITLLGRGHAHAFCSPPLKGVLALFEEEVERSLLIGNTRFGVGPLAWNGKTQRESFRKHLETLHARSLHLPKELRESWLYCMSTIDILDPINDVMAKHGLSETEMSNLGEQGFKRVIDDMPTRRVDMHLHKQVLRNPNYVARLSDLEDWGGLVPAACYCDVVVCEKHMADMLHRDGFTTQARVEVNLENTLPKAI
jgi:hypothetical protein